jgi:hypothetical protein
VSKISKVEAIRIIFKCAKLYSENLSGKNVFFISESNGKLEYFETSFLPSNFLHLTGVRANNKKERFFDAALNERLSPEDISFEPGGTTELKLNVLQQLMSIQATARMVGIYDNSRPLLIADKFAGTVTAAIGFISVNGMYIPKSALKVDMREITIKETRQKINAIFVKPRSDESYKRLTYIAKGVTIDDENLQQIIKKKVDMQNLTASSPIPRKPASENNDK